MVVMMHELSISMTKKSSLGHYNIIVRILELLNLPVLVQNAGYLSGSVLFCLVGIGVPDWELFLHCPCQNTLLAGNQCVVCEHTFRSK